MRLALLLLAASMLGAGTAAAQSSPPSTIARGFQGAWKGEGAQSDGGEWTIALTLADGRSGEVVGTITYPSLACGGDLVLRAADRRRVELLERITFGDCIDNGVVTLSPDGGGLDFDWRGEGLNARGKLARATPPPSPPNR